MIKNYLEFDVTFDFSVIFYYLIVLKNMDTINHAILTHQPIRLQVIIKVSWGLMGRMQTPIYVIPKGIKNVATCFVRHKTSKRIISENALAAKIGATHYHTHSFLSMWMIIKPMTIYLSIHLLD